VTARGWTHALLISAAALCGATRAEAQTTCHDVEVIVARGTLEHVLGPGSMNLDGPNSSGATWLDHPQGVWTQIRKELETPTDGSTPQTVVRYDLPQALYPADLNFYGSATMGTVAMINRINSQHSLCPNKRFVLLGYSQGAAVVGNVLSVASKRILNDQTKNNYVLGASASQKVVAAGLFADPGLRGDERTWFDATQYDRAAHGSQISSSDWLNGSFEDLNHRMIDGTVTPGASGIMMRPLGTFAQYHKDKVRDYCIWNDPICQGGSPSVLGVEHLYYAGDANAKRNLAVFALQKLRSYVDKTIPTFCTVTAASQSSLVGSYVAPSVRLRGYLADIAHAEPSGALAGERLITLKDVRAEVRFSGASATLLKGTLLAGSATAKATLLGYEIDASNTDEAMLDLTATGALSYPTIPLTSGASSYTLAPSSARSVTFLASSTTGKVQVEASALELVVAGTHPSTGSGVWAVLSCEHYTASAPRLNTVVLD
jgi:Cutinase